MTRMAPLRTIRAGVLEIAYFEAGPADGPPVLLMHGFPYDIHSYAEVAPLLARAGCRVIVPYLRGYGGTRFLSDATPRSGEQAALGADLLALLDALAIPRAVLAGYDWGGRAACVVAALWPERCAGLVSFNSYNIQDIAQAHGARRPPRTSTGSGTSTTSTANAAGPGWRPTGAASPACCGGSGRRPGTSTTPPSSAAPPPSTTPTSSRW